MRPRQSNVFEFSNNLNSEAMPLQRGRSYLLSLARYENGKDERFDCRLLRLDNSSVHVICRAWRHRKCS